MRQRAQPKRPHTCGTAPRPGATCLNAIWQEAYLRDDVYLRAYRARAEGVVPRKSLLCAKPSPLEQKQTRPPLACATLAPSFEHLVSTRKQRLRNRDTQRLRCLQIDEEIELGRLLHGQVAGVGPLEDLVHTGGSTAPNIGCARPIRHEAPGLY